jgi:chromosome segregation ATPase
MSHRLKTLLLLLALVALLALAGHAFNLAFERGGRDSKIEIILQRLKTASSEAESLRARCAVLREQCDSFSNIAVTARTELMTEKERNDPLRKQIEAISARETGLQAQAEKRQAQLSELKAKLAVAEEEVKTLKGTQPEPAVKPPEPASNRPPSTAVEP